MDEQVQLGQMEQRLRSVLDEKLQALEGRMDTKLQALEDRVGTKLQAIEDRIVTVSARVDLIKDGIESPEESMADIKKALLYLQDKWMEHDKAIWSLKRKA